MFGGSGWGSRGHYEGLNGIIRGGGAGMAGDFAVSWRGGEFCLFFWGITQYLPPKVVIFYR